MCRMDPSWSAMTLNGSSPGHCPPQAARSPRADLAAWHPLLGVHTERVDAVLALEWPPWGCHDGLAVRALVNQVGVRARDPDPGRLSVLLVELVLLEGLAYDRPRAARHHCHHRRAARLLRGDCRSYS